ncbi:MAG TPA: OmpA family protein [Tepidisphaeraceae bacterium]|jgi:outer membrane protein OmpA-like peptidoglycan-associated protein|nr:OmpA family protein [Tepidisphaeraceae bacterium]
MSSKCKCKKTECEECPEWIFTFADLVMLMMGFFVILWVLKPPAGKQGASDATTAGAPGQQWKDAVIGIREAFDYKPDPNSHDPIDMEMIKRARGTKNGAENLQPRKAPAGTDKNVTALRPGKHIIVGSHVLFDQGSVKVTPESVQILDEIAEKIRGHTAIVLVKGHASLDDLPDPSTPQQRMDISLRRAQAAQDYLIGKGVSPDVLRVQGCSTFEPVHQRAYNSAGQSENRRVEIEWTSQLVEERQDHSSVPTAPLAETPAAETDKTEKPQNPSDAAAKAE